MHATINNIRLAYTDEGSGPAIVLLHGFPLRRALWRPQIAALSAAGYRVVAPDLRGFGDSEAPSEGHDMDQYADDVAALMTYLGIGRAVVAGMSMGGYVLLNLLARHPQRIAGAVFMMSRCGADDEAGKRKRSALADEVRAGRPEAVANAFSEVLFAPATLQTNPQLVDEVRRWMQATPAAGLVGGLLAMRERPDYTARLGEFAVPALVVAGGEDRLMPLPGCEAFAAGLPLGSLCVIAGGGHVANLEQPEAANRCLLEFLAKVTPAGTLRA